MHRDAASKTTATYDVLVKESHNFVNDTEITSQQRHASAWRLGLTHRRYIGSATLNAGVSYQRGTRWFGALPAWEESWDDESYATALITPFTLGTQYFSHNIQYRRQMSNTPLTPQNKFAIGNRWTLSARRGWTLQNTLAWQTPLPQQEFYTGVDYGEVAGNSATQSQLRGRNVAGGVAGLRGAIGTTGVSYDLFAGIPLSKPAGFKTDPVTFGFSLNWNY